MKIQEISTARLRDYENNPRNNDLAVEKVKYSIERFGFLFPIVIDVNYVIVCGHTRVRACREMKIQKVPCIIAEELTEEQIKLFRLVDNKTSEYSEWDFDKLKKELAMVDLTLEKNQLLLERFELSSEVFDIDLEPPEIQVKSMNFLGDKVESKEKSTPISTIYSPPNDFTETENSFEEFEDNANFAEDEISEEPQFEEKKTEKAKAPQKAVFQFRFGETAFFISEIELNRLNEKYAEYLDSDALLRMSFVEYLLRGVKKRG